MFPSFANSSGRALAQKPLWETKSGHAYFGRVSGLILDGSLEVNPSRRAPLQQHCFLVICKDNSSNDSVCDLNIYLHTAVSMPLSTKGHHTHEPTRHRKHFSLQTLLKLSQLQEAMLRKQWTYLKKNQIKSMWRGDSCMMNHFYF